MNRRTDVTAQGRGRDCSGRLAWPEPRAGDRDESRRGGKLPSGPLQATLSSSGTLGSKKQLPPRSSPQRVGCSLGCPCLCFCPAPSPSTATAPTQHRASFLPHLPRPARPGGGVGGLHWTSLLGSRTAGPLLCPCGAPSPDSALNSSKHQCSVILADRSCAQTPAFLSQEQTVTGSDSVVLSASNVRPAQVSVHHQKRRLWRGSKQEEGMWKCKGNCRTRGRVQRQGEATAGEVAVSAALSAPPQSTWVLGTLEL